MVVSDGDSRDPGQRWGGNISFGEEFNSDVMVNASSSSCTFASRDGNKWGWTGETTYWHPQQRGKLNCIIETRRAEANRKLLLYIPLIPGSSQEFPLRVMRREVDACVFTCLVKNLHLFKVCVDQDTVGASELQGADFILFGQKQASHAKLR